MQEINLISHFFLEIFNFKEPNKLTGQKHFGPRQNQNFAR